MSKGYTINYFVKTLKSVNASTLAKTGVYGVVSPRFGSLSTKALALDVWLFGHTGDIFAGRGIYASFGKTSRARLLTALARRKKFGYV